VPTSCLVCEHPDAQVLYALPRFSILRCRACRHVYLSPLPSAEEIGRQFEALYATGRGEITELDGYNELAGWDDPSNPLVQGYGRWLDGLERHRRPGRLLDVGCGSGLFLATAQRRGWTAVGIDGSSEATRLAAERFGCEVVTGDIEALDAHASTATEPFDAITMWDVVEHARRPVALLDAARRRLAPGGVLGIAVPNQRNILDAIGGALYRATRGRLTGALEKQYVVQHFSSFDPDTLAAALARAGLEMIALRQEETDLQRLSLSTPMRLVLRGLFAVARLTGTQNRLFAVARARSSGG
jgi:2-polyprenyl-3-methyl-5-hydroxy-6-metoxy-1,4-benzoquinol methylase